MYFCKTNKYQARIDVRGGFDSPLCQCNDKLLINITESNINNGRNSYEIYIVHETLTGEWVEFKFYGLSEEEFDVVKYENKLLKLWERSNG